MEVSEREANGAPGVDGELVGVGGDGRGRLIRVRLEGDCERCLARCNELEMTPVANAMKLLHVCIYRSVNTGLFLTSLVATNMVDFMMLHS